MASGVAISQEVVDAYQQLKAKHVFKYLTCKLNDGNTEIVVDEAAPKPPKDVDESETWAKFCQNLPPSAPLYVFYDLSFSQQREGAGESAQNKVIFINWCPDNSPIKKRMVSASSKDALKKKLDPGIKEHQANDMSDMDLDEVIKKASK